MSDLISRDLLNALANCQDKTEIFAAINAAPTVDAEPVVMTDMELVDALRLCASHGSFCVGCPRRDVAGLSCMNELMLEAADRIAAGCTLRQDDSHKHDEGEHDD